MSYPYGRPGGQSGSGDPRGVGASGGQWVPVPGSGGPGSGGRRSSAGVIVGCCCVGCWRGVRCGSFAWC